MVVILVNVTSFAGGNVSTGVQIRGKRLPENKRREIV